MLNNFLHNDAPLNCLFSMLIFISLNFHFQGDLSERLRSITECNTYHDVQNLADDGSVREAHAEKAPKISGEARLPTKLKKSYSYTLLENMLIACLKFRLELKKSWSII